MEERGWKVVHSAGLGSAAAADVSRGCFHDYANSGLNFYFEATVESVFEEQERDWSNNKILKHKINWKERKKKFWI